MLQPRLTHTLAYAQQVQARATSPGQGAIRTRPLCKEQTTQPRGFSLPLCPLAVLSTHGEPMMFPWEAGNGGLSLCQRRLGERNRLELQSQPFNAAEQNSAQAPQAHDMLSEPSVF